MQTQIVIDRPGWVPNGFAARQQWINGRNGGYIQAGEDPELIFASRITAGIKETIHFKVDELADAIEWVENNSR